MTQKHGLFLDFDGTLADSLGGMRRAYEQLLTYYGATPTDEEFQQLNGPNLPTIVATLIRNHQLDVNPVQLQAHYLQLMVAAQDDVYPARGAHELINAATQAGWPVAVVTSANRAGVVAWLGRHGFSDAIKEVVGGDTVAHSKPYPEPYLTGLELTQCQASGSIAVEDTLSGTRSALGAGLTVYLVDPANQLASAVSGLEHSERVNVVPGLAAVPLSCFN